MLEHTFTFLPGIGEKRERGLWERGVSTWADYRAEGARGVKGVSARMKAQHDSVLAAAKRARNREDAGFFARLLPARDHWRAFGAWGADALFLDIETTGGVGGDAVTVVGMHRAGRTVTLVRDRDLTPAAVHAFAADARLIVTFNGSTFDVPVLERAGFPLPRIPHLDLRHALARLGLRGGLKAIERRLGLARGTDVEHLSGYDAVVLWHRHTLGDATALPVLLEYNQADVENMVPLARYAYDALCGEALRGLSGAGGRVVRLSSFGAERPREGAGVPARP